ncbi:hypothetical protein [Actinacidiphila sp. bgisy144]|uniref:hypothetical protein n=1 Tax=unclassified Actinacidiphila TaxID=2995708 RepID=UPI003EBD8AD1
MTGTEIETAVDTVIDRYVRLSDRAVHDDSALEELLSWFAADATVRVGPEPVPRPSGRRTPAHPVFGDLNA